MKKYTNPMRINRGFVKRAVSISRGLGILGTARFLAWLIKTQLIKSIIRWQETLGLYSYADWIRENERPSAGKRGPDPLATFFIFVDWQADVLAKLQFTLDFIRMQKLPDWECIVLFPAQHAVEFAGFSGQSDAEPKITFFPAQVINPDTWLTEILPHAHGEWVIITRPGDAHSAALLDFLSVQNGEIAYWDEDKVENNHRSAPS